MAISPLCRQFAAILKATPQIINGVCTASTVRNNIKPIILGKSVPDPFLPYPKLFLSKVLVVTEKDYVLVKP